VEERESEEEDAWGGEEDEDKNKTLVVGDEAFTDSGESEV